MNKILWLTPMTLALAGSALAEDNNLHPFAVRAGFNYLTSKDSRDATANGGYTVGLGYNLPLSYMPGSKFSVDVDYGRFSGNGNKGEILSFQGVVRSPLTLSPSSPSQFYWGAGVGLFNIKGSGSQTTTTTVGSTTTTTTTSFSHTKNVFGGSLLLGANLASNTSVELFYRISGTVEGYKTDTVGVQFGIHF